MRTFVLTPARGGDRLLTRCPDPQSHPPRGPLQERSRAGKNGGVRWVWATGEEETMRPFHLEPLSEEHRPWARKLLGDRWGSTQVVSRGNLIDAAMLQGFVAVDESGPIGLATFCVRDDACEIVTLDSQAEGKGVGSALITAVQRIAQFTGCRRLWLITTNDNTPALHFYQKRGFHLVAVHRNALEQSRRLKPEIPLVGRDGIPLRDEIEFEIHLDEPAGE